MATTKKNPGTGAGAKTTTSAKIKKASTAEAAPAKKPAGRLLRKEPIEIPRRPEHYYGRGVLAASLGVGDVLYTGSQRRLSTVEVLDIRAEKTNPETHLLIEAAAISLLLDDKEYTAGERVYLRVARDASLAVRSGPSN